MTALSNSAHLPRDLELQRASFYSAHGLVSNIMVGVEDEHPCVVFDFNSNSGEMAHTETVAAVKAESPKVPTTWLSRTSGLQLERVGEWILAFELGRQVGPEHFDRLLSDVLNLLEYANGFPQNV